MGRVNVVLWDNQRGLSRDTTVITDLLASGGHTVHVNGRPPGGRLALALKRAQDQLLEKVARRPRYGLCVFLETIDPHFARQARRRGLVPNPEWFRDDQRELLPLVDVVLCKTRHAQAIFERLGCRTEYVGFTSTDRRDGSLGPPLDLGFLHASGRSLQKGTRAVLTAWARHPEWPRLALVCAEEVHRELSLSDFASLPNVDFTVGYVEDDRLRALQNQCGIHLQPSEAEGFGHILVEALGVGAIVVTTDAPPMNEIVRPDRGCLAAYGQTRPQRLAVNTYVDPSALEARVAELIALPAERREEMRCSARRWFEENDASFRRSLAVAAEGLLA